MPRSEKDAFDWSLTYSPESDVKELPTWISDLVKSGKITHCVAIAERHTADDKWHIHCAFRYYRSYKSDYKWWTKLTDLKSPELEIRYHDCLLGLAGGYLTKADEGDREVLLTHGFTPEQLELGSDLYERGKLRKRIKSFVEWNVGIHPAKWNAAVGAVIAESGCTEEEAPAMLAQLGFCSIASKASSEVYNAMYLLRQRAQAL